MTCALFAAGSATRMYPLTGNCSKPLLEIVVKTILDWIVDGFATSGKIDKGIV